MGLVWIFLDGVGIGKDDPTVNPWAAVQNPTIVSVEGRKATWPKSISKPLDACLGVDGLPQSATGTTALLTGINAPAKLGKHLSGFPTADLQNIIKEFSIHKQAIENGLTSTFANAYNEAYFRRALTRQSVTTHAVRAAGIPFRMMDDYRDGKAVFHDLTGELIRIQGNGDSLIPPVAKEKALRRYTRNSDTFTEILKEENLEVIDPVEAGHRIAKLTPHYDIVLFEYVKTDMAGHAQDGPWANAVVQEVMDFVTTILSDLDLEKHSLLIASDHGNSEDLSVRSHTRNPISSFAVGPLSEPILSSAENITDLVPNVLKTLIKI